MSDKSKKISELVALTSPAPNDLLLVLDISASNTESNKKVTVADLLGDSSANVVIKNQTPANGTITIKQGTLLCDNTYLYIAVSNNVIKKIALSDF